MRHPPSDSRHDNEPVEASEVTPSGLSRSDAVLFCILAGAICTFAGGYTFGASNQGEHLLMIARDIDPEFLSNDFFLNAVEGKSPRRYYVGLMAQASSLLPLPLLFAMLSWLTNSAIAGVSWHVGRRMSPNNPMAAFLGCCLVLGVSAFTEGGAAQIPRDFLEPAHLARPLAMLGLWRLLNGDLVAPAVLLPVAILFHPLVGAETAAIALGAATCVLIWRAFETGFNRATAAGLARIASLAALLGIWFIALYGGRTQTLSPERFIHIIGTRAPHHYLPSTWGLGSHLAFLTFVVASFLAWRRWSEGAPDLDQARGILVVCCIVLIACLGGFVFVELVPVRLWTEAQVFRMTYLIKWFGLLLTAAVAARALRTVRTWSDGVAASLLVVGVGRYQPAILLLGHLGLHFDGESTDRRSSRHQAFIAILGIVALAAIIVSASSRPGEPFILASLLALSASFITFPRPAVRRAVSVACVGAFLALLVTFRATDVVTDAARWAGVRPPQITLEEWSPRWGSAARFANTNLAVDAIFVVPPAACGFRLLAERAVVIESKCLPFNDDGLEAWYDRMLDAYAPGSAPELPSINTLQTSYAAIQDSQLANLGRKYGASHALLLRDTSTAFPTLFEGDAYRIVRIESR